MHRACFVLLWLVLPLLARATPAEDLAHVDHFAFGPLGYGGGRISDGEKYFRRILAEPAPATQLVWVAIQGSPAARFYAMVGLYEIDRAAYERLKVQIVPLSCLFKAYDFGYPISGEKVLRDIESGSFRRYLTAPAAPTKLATAQAAPVWLTDVRVFTAPNVR
jgi:hypothetical protein